MREWKSEVWWRNRPVEERVKNLHIPKRIQGSMAPHAVDFEENLFIQGSSGSGKSAHAARTLYNIVTNNKVSGRWVEADDYIEMIKDTFDDGGELPEMYSSPHLVKYIKASFDVIVLDGLGEERLTEFATHELGSLIRKRFEKEKATIITSRLSIQDIKHRYGARLATPLADFDFKAL